MNGKELSAALSGLPEDMIAEAMNPDRKRRTIPWLRIAVCFAAVLAVVMLSFLQSDNNLATPGVLTITVYALDDSTELGYKEVALTEGIDTGYRNSWPLGLSIVPGIPVQLSLESDEFPTDAITYAIHVDQGAYLDMTNGRITKLSDPVIRPNPTTCYWVPSWGENPEGKAATDLKQVYTDVIIYCGERIIGYAVVLFEQDPNNSGIYDTYLLSSVLFPKNDEEYQEITEEYINDCIEFTKTKIKGR